ncbi:MAG: OmpA family protein [Proteobacteria bacterium]|nr:OmpA family protein [Pseudomonadota bacterium]
MRLFRSLKTVLILALAGVGASAAPAFAQQAMYPGQNVDVDPSVSRGNKVLLYPGGNYIRVVPQLLEPGAPYPGTGDIVRLHLPKKHARRKHPENTNVAAAPVSEQPALAPPPVAVRQPAAKKVASTQPPPPAQEDNTDATIPLSMSTTRALPPAPAKQPARNQQKPPPQQPPAKQVATATPPSPPQEEAGSDTAIPLSLSGSRPFSLLQAKQQRLNAAQPQRQSAQQQASKQQSTKQQPAQQQPTVQVASATPPPRSVQTPPAQKLTNNESSANRANLSKHGQIKFRKNAIDLVPAAMDGIRLLANDLTSALDAGAQRVQLEAYGGPPGDKSSESRRLSLKRALTIRQLLIDNGVPSSRIDVRAMGGASDGGALDRVDVFVRA